MGLYTDWQLALDDPLTQIACGDIQPWVGAAANLNPPQSESQPTPIPGTGLDVRPAVCTSSPAT